jgi:hypothetical protein
MRDQGAPRHRAVRPGSQTSSLEWQSFEIRMRYRRAERCIQHAEAALAAGLEEDARAAVAEAAALDPNTPAFETLRDAVGQRQAAERSALRRAGARRFGAVAALVVALGAAGFWLRDSGREPAAAEGGVTAPATPSTETAHEAPVPEAAAAAEPLPVREPAPPADTATDAEARAIEDEASSARDATVGLSGSRSRRSPAGLPPLKTARPGVRDPDNAGEVTPTTGGLPEVRGSTPPPRIDRVVTGLPAGVLPSARVPAAAPPPSAATSPGPPDRETPPVPARSAAEVEEAKVRNVLARFASAYSSLDAAAAQQVWLEVDEPSLWRAFESLESQRVSLGQCAVSVTGATARAECSGSTTWTPRIGGRTQTEARHWQFDLSATNGRWLIVRASAR